MAERESKSGAAFIEGLFLGAVIGGALALIYAPQSGKETREWLKRIKDDNQDIIDEAMVSSESAVTAAKKKIEDSFKAVSHLVEGKKVKGKGE
jgi:gas vesicle protein